LRYFRDNFGEAGDRESAEVDEDSPAGARELGTTKAGDVDVGRQGSQFADQRTGVEVARDLSAGEEQPGLKSLGA